MLLQTISEIKEFLPIGVGNDFNRLKPHIENAENKYIKPLLGIAIYDELQEFYDEFPYDNPTEVQEITTELLYKVQHSVIHLAYFIGYDFLNVSISDSGFNRLETENKKGLFKYQEDNLKKYFSDSGFNSLDDILVFLETNIAHFGEFKATANWTEFKGSFIPNVAVLEKIPFNIFGSRLTFLSLKPHLAFVEDTTIKLALGTDIYDEIKAGMILDDIPEKVSKILPYIRKPLIYFASALFMSETGATLGNNALYFDKSESTAGGISNKVPATEERIMDLIKRNNFIGNSYLDILKTFLISEAESWSNFDGKTGSLFNRDNTNKKTFWA